ncbi:MAG: NAD+ synthase [Methylococcaceae bacterium]|nr:MAG: NAD+ synthase [Methylococcaceae bacterium]
MNTFSIAIAQTDLLVGDITGNTRRIIDLAQRAKREPGCRAVVFPELTLSGYPPEDLLLRADFLERCAAALQEVAQAVSDIDVILGFPEQADGKLYNSAAVLRDGRIHALYRKQALPNYGVFDEKRYFTPGSEPCVFLLAGVPVGLCICEDIWVQGPVEQAVGAGAKLMINLNASPYDADKSVQREQTVQQRVAGAGIPVIYVNLVGGQDELVFDGASFALNALGQLVLRTPEFQSALIPLTFQWDGVFAEPLPGLIAPLPPRTASIYNALVTGIRDYVRKNGFKGAVLGLSGGIDSALVLALAVDALGAGQVEVLLMPSRYTADMSVQDAVAEAEALGVRHHLIPIEPALQVFNQLLANVFADCHDRSLPDTTEENIQARCRGLLLMALSNKTGKILLTTGNKSEMSVGYATLYGDMAGGFAPIKDVPKLLVYELAEYRNSLAPVIPQRVIDRPPSAELRPDQKDEDSLPPYPVLDPILALYVEQDQSAAAIIAAGYPEHEVRRVLAMVDRNEYKRRQAPPGIKITARAFGRDRRYPMTCGFKGA